MFPAPPDLFLQSAAPHISLPLSPFLRLAPSSAPLCHDAEGWGPMSPTRYDFTPCFMDLWVALVAGFALLLGPGALWFLRYKQVPQPVGRNWHFYAKLVSE
jgi:ATP-binding cassette, subfamily C (CFTR/MRP), member 1